MLELRAVSGMLRLGSAALPIGAFAYSQGLEQAVADGSVAEAAGAERWIAGLCEASLLAWDVPILVRLARAWSNGSSDELRRWNDFSYASRGSRELREEDRQLGGALFRLLARLGEARAEAWVRDARATLGSAFALAGEHWGIPIPALAASYCFAWSEAQVGAATRLIPLGQSDAQRVLSSVLARVEAGLPAALARDDAEIFPCAPGQALLSAAHESLYSRLFRS